MAIATREWIDLIEGEYLRDFVTNGGAGVKFAVGDADQLAAVGGMLAGLSDRHGLAYVSIDAATTKLHMIQDVFFAIARALDWNAMAQHFVEFLFERQGYEWPRPGEAVPLHEVAACNRIDVILMRRDFHQWLTAEVMRDTEMTQDFRVAMTRLCLRRLEPADTQPGITAPVLEWLRGELRRIGALKEPAITAKITRHNGRAMLRSLCRWLRLCGQRGLCATVDIRQLGKTGTAAGDRLRYSPAAVMDGFEVMRQLVDDAERFAGLLLVIIADETLIEVGSRRSLDAYVALKMRIWDDVRPEGRDNPLAPLVRFVGQAPPASMRAMAAP